MLKTTSAVIIYVDNPIAGNFISSNTEDVDCCKLYLFISPSAED